MALSKGSATKTSPGLQALALCQTITGKVLDAETLEKRAGHDTLCTVRTAQNEQETIRVPAGITLEAGNLVSIAYAEDLRAVSVQNHTAGTRVQSPATLPYPLPMRVSLVLAVIIGMMALLSALVLLPYGFGLDKHDAAMAGLLSVVICILSLGWGLLSERKWRKDYNEAFAEYATGEARAAQLAFAPRPGEPGGMPPAGRS